MNCWKYLELSETVDQRQIKKAYAKKLKQHQPEDDPQGFKTLRKMYEQALELSRHLTQISASPIASSPIEKVTESDDADIETPTNSPGTLENQEPQELAEQLMDRVVATYMDFEQRTQPAAWHSIFASDAFWNLEVKQRLAVWIFQFIGQHSYLPDEILQILQQQFSWFQNYTALVESFDEEQVDQVLNRIHSAPWSLSYNNLSFSDSMQADDIDKYLLMREQLEFYVLRNNQEEITELIESMTRNTVNDPEYFRLLCFFYINNQDYNKALEYSERYIEQCSTQTTQALNGYLEKADILYQKNDYTAATTAYQAVLEIDEEHAIALRGLAACYFERGQTLEAKSLYEQAIEALAYDTEARIQLTRINQTLIQDSLKILKIHTDDAVHRMQVAQAYYEIGAYEDSESSIQTYIRSCPIDKVNYNFWLLLGNVYEAMEANEPALNTYQLALAAAQREGINGYDALIRIGVLLLDASEYDEALRFFDHAQHFDPGNASIISKRADVYRYKNEYDTALTLINQAIATDDTCWIYFSIRALIHMELENFRQALPDIEVVLRNEYLFSAMWHNKGLCHARLENHQQAIDDFTRAISYKQDYTEAFLSLAASQYETAEYDEALNSLTDYERYNGDRETVVLWQNKINTARQNRLAIKPEVE